MSLASPYQGDVIAQHIAWLFDCLQTIDEVRENIVSVYKQDQLLQASARIGLPLIGITYLGMQANQSTVRAGAGGANVQKASHSLTANMFFDIYVVNTQEPRGGEGEVYLETTYLLDRVRQAILVQQGPQAVGEIQRRAGGGRQWKFVSETPAEVGKLGVVYVQRWAISASLVV